MSANSGRPALRRRSGYTIAVCAAMVLAVAGCGSSTGGGSSKGGGSSATSNASSTAAASKTAPPTTISSHTLTIQFAPPVSMNPALGGAGDSVVVYAQPDYSSLTYVMPNGSFRPDLATSWGYAAGSHNQVFDMTVRKGVRFSDGSPLTGKAVAASLNYFKHADGPQGTFLSNMSSAKATGPYTVRLTFSSPEPGLPLILSQTQGPGQIIGPKGLASPKTLTTTSDGAGPYILSAAKTVANSEYVFTRNPHYWNPSAIHYSAIGIKVIQNSQTALSSAQSGQVDALSFMPGKEAPQAKAAGLQTWTAATAVQALVLSDRYDPSSPLGKLKVRQAINYAVNRAQLAAGLGGTGSVPTDQLALAGLQGYSSALSNRYPYDVAKAKQLLAQAGYPHGFTLPILDMLGFDPNGDVAAALKSELAAVGITVQITTEPAPPQFIPQALSKKFPAMLWQQSAFPTSFTWTVKYGLTAFLNPFGPVPAALNRMLSTVGAATGAAANAQAQKLNAYLVDNAWYLPLFSMEWTEAAAKSIANVSAPTADNAGIFDPIGPSANLSWYPARSS